MARSVSSAFEILGMGGDMGSIGRHGLDLLMNPVHTRWLAPALLVADAVLCALIIKTVPYTEIDWRAYMEQVAQYIAGERDYELIKGGTGPLVYPAMHVYIYRALYWLTREGTSIVLAQVWFAVLYVFNLAVVMACYRKAKAPPYIFPMLVLSKRLHSIYVLRCFNDGFAMTFFFLAIYCFQNRDWSYGAIIFSLGLGVKMSVLLALPAVVILLYQANGPWSALGQVSYILQSQLLLGIPFLRKNARGYVGRAFQLTRQFKYEWTVNWKFVPEETFLSKGFSVSLIILHVSLLALYAFTRWFRPLGRSPRDLMRLALLNPTPEAQRAIVRQMSSDFILTAMLSSIAIGMLCARSLHYQFFSWIAWASPWLLYKTGVNPLLQVFLWMGQELAWNQYPPNELSSKIVVGVLAVTVVQVWVGTDVEAPKNVVGAAGVQQQPVAVTKKTEGKKTR